MTSNTQTLGEEDSEKLLKLCRECKLYEVERWITAGRPIRIFGKRKKAPLDIAIEQGFHSLVELLARNEPDQDVKNKALNQVVEKKRLDLVQLLVSAGAEIRTVSLIDVLLTWEPNLIRFFLDQGADAVTSAPFAVAFAERIRTALRPFVDYRQAHPELSEKMQSQVDQALRYVSKEGDLKWVSLMLWAGANPRTPGPSLFEGHEDDPDWHTTAVHEACYHGHVEILRKFKLRPDTDDLAELVGCVLSPRNSEALNHILSLGGNLNNKPNGGSTAMDHCLGHIRFDNFDPLRPKTQISRYDVSKTLETMNEFAHQIWPTLDSPGMTRFRDGQET